MNNIKNLKLFLLDMDGTIYLDNDLFDGVTDFLAHIKSIGGKYIFLTNNSSKSVDSYIKKLKTLGINATAEDFLTSTDATIVALKNKNYNKIYALGTISFKEQLIAAGLPITDKLEDGIDCLCMGFDTELTFKKLEDACILLTKDIDYIATNPDWVCPTSFGSVPDCGSVSEMLYNATKKRPTFIGKPQPAMALLAMQKTGFSPNETVVIGDRIYTDIACGVNAKINSIFLLSGEGTIEDIKKYKIKPDYIYKDIKTLLQDIKE